MSKYYAVLKGRRIGLFSSWRETQPLVTGYPNAQFKSFKRLTDAEAYLYPTTGITDYTIYTDGSCIDCIGGYGVVVVDCSGDVVRRISRRVPGISTNNIAELMAIHRALKHIKRHDLNPVTIFTDSMYSLKCLLVWYDTWIANDWLTSKGKAVKNKELIREIRLTFDAVPWVKIKHVPAHAGVTFNELADTLANTGRMK